MHQPTLPGIQSPTSGKTAPNGVPEINEQAIHDCRSGPSRTLALKGAKAPNGLFMLLRIIVMTAVSVMIASELGLSEGRLIQPKER